MRLKVEMIVKINLNAFANTGKKNKFEQYKNCLDGGDYQ